MSDNFRRLIRNLRKSSEGKRCSRCKEPVNVVSGDWRWNGSEWEHACPDRLHGQCGHFIAERIPAVEANSHE